MMEPVITSTHNQAEFTVSEFSSVLKKSVEERFSHVRIRGEISGLKRAPSGHVYLSLKDGSAVLAAVCWKGVAASLTFQPQDGLEVICTGRVTTYAGQSKYQLVISHIEPAGVGALMALLEQRKKQLAAEGLFAPERKQALPFLPEVIGVVTSPTGAVIRDILHRLSERFPVHVVIWPVLVQGEMAASQITAAIDGFNQHPLAGVGKQPDILIVARGGGSIEDLWSFNEENVVRAVANSKIPVISAVGHETDTTLIDYVSDRRAPTPTAAAELAVPVRADLIRVTADYAVRSEAAMQRMLEQRRRDLRLLMKALRDPKAFIEHLSQGLDHHTIRLQQALPMMLTVKKQSLHHSAVRLRLPSEMLHVSHHTLGALVLRFQKALGYWHQQKQQALQLLSQRLVHMLPKRQIDTAQTRYNTLSTRLDHAFKVTMDRKKHQHQLTATMLESFSYQKILKRGFALMRDEAGEHITSAKTVVKHRKIYAEFADGTATLDLSGKKSGSKASKASMLDQPSLFSDPADEA